jgi:hypothetical protein
MEHAMPELTITLDEDTIRLATEAQHRANAVIGGHGYPDRLTLEGYIAWLVKHTLDQQRIARQITADNEEARRIAEA